MYNSDEPGTNTVITRNDTAPHGVGTPMLLADCCLASVLETSSTRAGCGSIPRSQILPYMYSCDEPGAITVSPRDNAAPYGVETQPRLERTTGCQSF